MSAERSSKIKLRGFTLTELAIVLGIIGLILGAIWTAAAKVYMNNRIAKAVTEVLSVASSVRNTYAGKGIVSPGFIDLTTPGIALGWFPNDMIQSGVCNDVTAQTCPITPWNTAMRVLGNWPASGAPAAPNKFEILFDGGPNGYSGTPPAECPAFMAAIVSQAANLGLDFIYSDVGQATAISSTTPLALTDPHIANCGGNIVLDFSL